MVFMVNEILDAFCFDKAMDEKSAELLKLLLKDKKRLAPKDIVIKNNVIIFGAGPSLKGNVIDIKKLDKKTFTNDVQMELLVP